MLKLRAFFKTTVIPSRKLTKMRVGRNAAKAAHTVRVGFVVSAGERGEESGHWGVPLGGDEECRAAFRCN